MIEHAMAIHPKTMQASKALYIKLGRGGICGDGGGEGRLPVAEAEDAFIDAFLLPIAKTKGPLFVTIKPCRVKGHIGTVNFVEKAGGGWLAEGEPAQITIPPIEHLPGKLRPPKEQQQGFQFPPLS